MEYQVDKKDVMAIKELMSHSEFHRTYNNMDFERLIIPPLMSNQYAIWFDKETGKPKACMTWAWLNREAETAFLTRTRSLQPADFAKTHKDDQLWVIDIIAPYNNILATIKHTREILSELTDSYGCFVRRNLDGSIKRLGYIKSIAKRKDNVIWN